MEPAAQKIVLDATAKATQLSIETLWMRALDMSLITVDNSGTTTGRPEKENIKDGDIWEIYPGSMLNVVYGTRNPAPIELLIHVLSLQDRNSYYAEFARVSPRFVSIAKPRQFTPWLYNWHWPFFRSVLADYRQKVSNTDFSLWSRAETTDPIAVRSEKAHFGFPLMLEGAGPAEACAYRLHEVTVEYVVDNPMKWLPVVGRSDRFLIRAENIGRDLPAPTPVSLPPDSGCSPFRYSRGQT